VPKEALAEAGVPSVSPREGSQSRDHCPDCSLVLLLGEIDGVEVEYCPGCWAVWFDTGELERVASEYKSETDWSQVASDVHGIRAFVRWLQLQMSNAKLAIEVAKRLGG
jgi:Zn-finger nucleic acid-binding protein